MITALLCYFKLIIQLEKKRLKLNFTESELFCCQSMTIILTVRYIFTIHDVLLKKLKGQDHVRQYLFCFFIPERYLLINVFTLLLFLNITCVRNTVVFFYVRMQRQS
jgi:hypothetical protein